MSLIPRVRLRPPLTMALVVALFAVACGAASPPVPTSVKYVPVGFPDSEISITLNSDGTFVWPTGPGNLNEIWNGTYKRDDGAKTVTFAVQAAPATQNRGEVSAGNIIATIDASGCIVLQFYRAPLCPGGSGSAPSSNGGGGILGGGGGILPGGGGGSLPSIGAGGGPATTTVTYYPQPGYTGSFASITIRTDGTWILSSATGQSTNGTYTRNADGSLNLTAPGPSGTPITATGRFDSAGCITVTVTLCPNEALGPAPSTGGGIVIPGGGPGSFAFPTPNGGADVTTEYDTQDYGFVLQLRSDGAFTLADTEDCVCSGSWTGDPSGKFVLLTWHNSYGEARDATATADAAGCLTLEYPYDGYWNGKYCPRP